MMNHQYYDICFEILNHYLHFGDVNDTYKSICKGLDYLRNFPATETDFYLKQEEIITYIMKVRENNIVDAYKSRENPLLFISVPSGRSLEQASSQELYNNLAAEIPRLICKGIHQIIKHINPNLDANELTAELVQENPIVLQKYNLLKAWQ